MPKRESLRDPTWVRHLPRWLLDHRVHLCYLEKASFFQADVALSQHTCAGFTCTPPFLVQCTTQTTVHGNPCLLLVQSGVAGMKVGIITWSPPRGEGRQHSFLLSPTPGTKIARAFMILPLSGRSYTVKLELLCVGMFCEETVTYVNMVDVIKSKLLSVLVCIAKKGKERSPEFLK